MKRYLLIYPGNETLGRKIAEGAGLQIVDFKLRRFPDGESYFQLLSAVQGGEVVILCSLFHPDEKIVQLIYMAETCRHNGATRVTLIAPYLPYMRQDKAFKPGEAVTSGTFADIVSAYFDKLITIEPHLHRIASLDDIYSITTHALSSAASIAAWVKEHVPDALLTGPDEESTPWIENVAQRTGLPYTVLTKIRSGDREVKLEVPDISKYQQRTPVIIDDIVSTATTMIKAVKLLIEKGARPPVCIATHAVFAADSFRELKDSGAEKIVTTNTIPHESNEIDISGEIIGCLNG